MCFVLHAFLQTLCCFVLEISDFVLSQDYTRNSTTAIATNMLQCSGTYVSIATNMLQCSGTYVSIATNMLQCCRKGLYVSTVRLMLFGSPPVDIRHKRLLIFFVLFFEVLIPLILILVSPAFS